MNSEINVLIEILNEKRDMINFTMTKETLNKQLLDQMNGTIHELDVTFLDIFTKIKEIHGHEVFQNTRTFTREDIRALQNVIKATQEAEAIIWERINREEFESVKSKLVQNTDRKTVISKYKKNLK